MRVNVKKWSLRILIGVVALVLLLLLAVQVVLWTSLPQNWVLGAIQEKLQLRVGASNLSTGWTGQTSLSDVTLSLPLAQEAFLQTPRLSVRHTPLYKLLVGMPLKVESIGIDRPNLLVRQQTDGRWNLEEVAELIRRAGGGKTPETQPQTRTVPDLPSVDVTDATIRLVDVQGRQATLQPLTVTGRPQGPLVWKYEATIPDRFHLTGEVAPGADWQHSATIQLANLGPIVRPFLPNPSPAVVATLENFNLDAHWVGRVDGNVKGRLDLKDLYFGGYDVTGPLAISFDDGGSGVTTINPAGMQVTSPFKDRIPPARASAGSIAVDGRSATVKDLSLAFAGGELRLGGSYAWTSGTGKVEAWWNKLILPEGTTHSGSLTASLRQPWPNQPAIDVTLTSDGQRGSGESWNTRLALSGTGTAWDHIDWRLDAPALVYQRAGQAYNLDHLAAALSTRGNALTLDSLSLPAGALYGPWRRGTLAASGRYDFTSGEWDVFLSGDDWPLSPKAKTPADFMITADGDRAWARLREFYLDGSGVQVWAYGDVSYLAKGTPAELHVYGWYPPLDYTWHEQDGDARDDVKFSGQLASELHLTRGAWPVNLDVNGTLYAKQFRIKNHPVGDVAVKVEGFADAEHVQLNTSRLELLSGVWGLTADYRYKQRLSKLEVKLQELSLAQLDNFAATPPNIRGTMSGHWFVRLPQFDLNQMTAEGDYSIHDLGRLNSAPPTTAPSLAASIDKPRSTASTTAPAATPAAYVTAVAPSAAAPAHATTTTSPSTRPSLTPIADVVTGKVAVAHGQVTLDPILMQRKQTGSTKAKITFPVAAPRNMHAEVNAAAWPIDFTDVDTHETSNVLLWLQTTLDLDLKRITAEGPVHALANIARNEKTVANVSVDATIHQRRVDLRSITGEGLGGRISGDGYLHLDNPLQSAGRVDWQNIDAAALIEQLPFTKGLVGRYTGSVRFSPTDRRLEPNATGPFAVSGTVNAAGGNWHGLEIGNASFVAHADHDRAVLDNLTWSIAGGTLKAWTRATWYDGIPFLHVDLNVDRLSLDQIVGAARPAGQSHKPMPGRITGRAVAAGSPFDKALRTQASGDIRLRLTESDLANVASVNLLYSVLSVQLGPPVPTGRGVIEARLEGERLEVPVIRYFNRGVDVWANTTVVNVFEGAKSPIEGTAAGSARPLKDLKLPFMADVDQIFRALQGAVATVSIEGTIGDPKPRVIPFAQAGDAFRRFMLGEVKNEVRGTAGR